MKKVAMNNVDGNLAVDSAPAKVAETVKPVKKVAKKPASKATEVSVTKPAKKPAPKRSLYTYVCKPNGALCRTVVSNAAKYPGNILYAKVPLEVIDIDESYQRHVRPEHVDALASHWDFAKAGALVVSYRPEEGLFVANDGQHRLFAARKLGIQELLCQINTDLTLEQEAELFANQNSMTVKVSQSELTKAGVVAKHKDALFLAALCDKYRVNLYGGSAVGSLSAIKTAKVIYGRSGEEILENIFKLIEDMGWSNIKGGYSRTVFLACERILTRYAGFEREVFKSMKQLNAAHYPPHVHISQAKLEHPHVGSDCDALTAYWGDYIAKAI